MFNSKSNKLETPQSKAASTSIIGAGATLSGDIKCTDDLRIDGTLIGNIFSSAKVVIGASGKVEGDIHANHADIMGTTIGCLRVKDMLNLRGEAAIDGDIFAGKLAIEPTVTFNGRCHMGANVVEMNVAKEEQQLAIAK
jgi:cytoskeletal protein CcmA (bactofilin family)